MTTTYDFRKHIKIFNLNETELDLLCHLYSGIIKGRDGLITDDIDINPIPNFLHLYFKEHIDLRDKVSIKRPLMYKSYNEYVSSGGFNRLSVPQFSSYLLTNYGVECKKTQGEYYYRFSNVIIDNLLKQEVV